MGNNDRVGGGAVGDRRVAQSDASGERAPDVELRVLTGRTVLREAAPRLLRDILGPTLCFYAGWKLAGLVVGIALGTTFALGAFRYERRHGRPGNIARLVLAFVIAQALIGLVTHSAKVYLVQPSILGTLNGLVWLGSVAVGRPLAAAFAGEVFPVDEATRQSEVFRAVFRRVSVVFGVFFLIFAGIQLSVLLTVGVDAFVAARVLDSVCILIAIIWAVRYAVGELGSAFRAAPA